MMAPRLVNFDQMSPAQLVVRNEFKSESSNTGMSNIFESGVSYSKFEVDKHFDLERVEAFLDNVPASMLGNCPVEWRAILLGLAHVLPVYSLLVCLELFVGDHLFFKEIDKHMFRFVKDFSVDEFIRFLESHAGFNLSWAFTCVLHSRLSLIINRASTRDLVRILTALAGQPQCISIANLCVNRYLLSSEPLSVSFVSSLAALGIPLPANRLLVKWSDLSIADSLRLCASLNALDCSDLCVLSVPNYREVHGFEYLCALSSFSVGGLLVDAEFVVKLAADSPSPSARLALVVAAQTLPLEPIFSQLTFEQIQAIHTLLSSDVGAEPPSKYFPYKKLSTEKRTNISNLFSTLVVSA